MRAKPLIAVRSWGSVSALGTDPARILESYKDKKSLAVLRTFNGLAQPVVPLGPDGEALLKDVVGRVPKTRRFDRCVLMAVAASESAFRASGWEADKDRLQIGVNIGSSRGATGFWEKSYEEFLRSPGERTPILTSPLTTLGHLSSAVANVLVLEGPIISSSMTCSTAAQAVFNAMAWLKAGMADRFLAGGSEAPLTPFTLAHVGALGILSDKASDPYPCRPLAAEPDDNTVIVGEGACVFALEALPPGRLAAARVAGIIESIGYGFEKIPSPVGLTPEGEALRKAMAMALHGQMTDAPVDLVIMHAPGTLQGDEAELTALRRVFGDSLPDLYSNKWKIGHTFGASAAFSLELALLVLRHQLVLSFPYPSLVRNRGGIVRKVMVNSTGFGGNAASLIVSSPSLF
jgi:3-oxoacyl-[acyl-carrier-protein] synthase II